MAVSTVVIQQVIVQFGLSLSPSIEEVHTHQRKYSKDEPNDNQHP